MRAGGGTLSPGRGLHRTEGPRAKGTAPPARRGQGKGAAILPAGREKGTEPMEAPKRPASPAVRRFRRRSRSTEGRRAGFPSRQGYAPMARRGSSHADDDLGDLLRALRSRNRFPGVDAEIDDGRPSTSRGLSCDPTGQLALRSSPLCASRDTAELLAIFFAVPGACRGVNTPSRVEEPRGAAAVKISWEPGPDFLRDSCQWVYSFLRFHRERSRRDQCPPLFDFPLHVSAASGLKIVGRQSASPKEQG